MAVDFQFTEEKQASIVRQNVAGDSDTYLKKLSGHRHYRNQKMCQRSMKNLKRCFAMDL